MRLRRSGSIAEPRAGIPAAFRLTALFVALLWIAIAPGFVHADGDSHSTRTFRLMSLNLRHGDGPRNGDNLDEVVALIKRVHPDVVAIQEVDQGVARSGGAGSTRPARLGNRHVLGVPRHA